MLGIIITLQLLIIGALIVLAHEVADVQKHIKYKSDEIADIHVAQCKLSIQLDEHFSDMKKAIEQVEVASSQPELSEDSDSFAQRIEQIKNELGLQVKIADEQKKGTEAVSFHPGVYNIQDEVRATYQGNEDVEYAK